MHLIGSIMRQGFSLERVLFCTFVLSVCGAAIMIASTVMLQRASEGARARIGVIDDYLQVSAAATAALKDVEIAERDYFLRHAGQTRARFAAAAATLREGQRTLVAAGQASGTTAVADIAQTLNELLTLRLAELERAVATGHVDKAGESAARLSAELSGRAQFLTAERHAVEAESQRLGQRTMMAVVATSATILAALGAAIWLVAAELKARQATAGRDAHAARHDALTGLANRAMFDEWLRHVMADARREAAMPALVYLDLDGFKPINDRLGHSAGDQVLIEVARRFRATVRESDLLARLGGDEFVVLSPRVKERAEAFALAERLVVSLREPIRYADQDLAVGASVGVAVAGASTVSAQALVDAADAAMYRAKKSGKGTVSA